MVAFHARRQSPSEQYPEARVRSTPLALSARLDWADSTARRMMCRRRHLIEIS